MARAVELIEQECTIDFIDINMGCPIDIVVNKGAGSALLTKPMRMKNIVEVASSTVDRPITIKVFVMLSTILLLLDILSFVRYDLYQIQVSILIASSTPFSPSVLWL